MPLNGAPGRAPQIMTTMAEFIDIDALPYRPCVGLVILDSAGRIFAGQRIDGMYDAWQMPQGGIDEGETPREAGLREMSEETGITPDKVEILRESSEWLPYDLPRHLVPKLWNGRYRGQKQRWIALRFHGTDADVNIETDEPEFRVWAWMAHGELIDRIVNFKRDTYRQVLDEFGDLF
jgi:putative (di)nucleoside polyphosphate hydrolase